MELFEANTVPVTKNKDKLITSSTGRVIAGITGSVTVGLLLVCSSFVSPAFRRFCLPYVPATDKQISNVLKALRGDKGNLLDLGSGDGRIVLETAKINLISHGVELNPWLVIYAKFVAWKEGLWSSTKFFKKDLWKYDISKYDNIVIFGVEQMMEDLEKKFKSECKNDCKIIACRFPLPKQNPTQIIGAGVDTVWVYKINRHLK